MIRVFALVNLFIGSILFFLGTGIFVSESNHMGSRIFLAEKNLREITSEENPKHSALTEQAAREVGRVISEGKLGFKLLWKVLDYLYIAAGALVLNGGIIFAYDVRQRKTLPPNE